MAKRILKEKPLKPLLEALQELNCDGKTKSAAFSFLKKDFTQVRSERDFQEAFNGLMALDQLLSPQHRAYRDAIAGLRKTLEAYHKVNKWLLPDEAVKRLEAGWREICQTFQKYLPVEAWEGIEKVTIESFSDVRKTLERSRL